MSKPAEDALEGRSKDIPRIRLQGLAGSTIDWSVFDVEKPGEMRNSPAKRPRKYQREPVAHVLAGSEAHDRGELMMAWNQFLPSDRTHHVGSKHLARLGPLDEPGRT